ncbi:lipopolysaccharide assembly protein LapA domain-containing protein [Streptacidiphilus monticola]|jgi:uncharacterized integral membrane protein|uniref:Lipopolysaccharide assembly protein LapA domain-containing protein n=1 Tax=Streptacidiphilus monticola TaxID=2161674 RepID=A0ABW1FWH1_9ACTN
MSNKPPKTQRPSTLTVRGREVRLRTIGAVVLLGLALWFVFANTQSVKVRLWVADVTMPLWLVLFVTLVVGAAIGGLLARRQIKR